LEVVEFAARRVACCLHAKICELVLTANPGGLLPFEAKKSLLSNVLRAFFVGFT
jgi:hypothetical protein